MINFQVDFETWTVPTLNPGSETRYYKGVLRREIDGQVVYETQSYSDSRLVQDEIRHFFTKP